MEAVYPHRYFHITRHDLGQTVSLKPSGEFTPPGVSFSPIIRGCIKGVPFNVRSGNTWYVYTPVIKTGAIIPDTIDDFKRTGERRVLHKIKAILIGAITVMYKNNKWEYQWQKPRRKDDQSQV